MSRKPRNARKTPRRSRADPIARERALDALSRMRSDGLSLTRAAKHTHTTPETVRKYVGQALVKSAGGRYAATPSDRLTRHIRILTKDGIARIRVRGSKPASRVARYMAAVDRYLRTGNADALNEFRGQRIRARNATYHFLTDLPALDRLGHAGEISFDRLYVLRA